MNEQRNQPCPRCRAKGRDSTGDHAFLLPNRDAYFCSRCKAKMSIKEVEEGEEVSAGAPESAPKLVPTSNSDLAFMFAEGIPESASNKTSAATSAIGSLFAQSPLGSSQELSKAPADLVALDVPSRGLRAETLETYCCTVEVDQATGEPKTLFCPIRKDGEPAGQKAIGLQNKTFRALGDGKEADLRFREFSNGNKLVIITEGEIDALSVKQMLEDAGKGYTVVSLPNGAGSVPSKSDYAWLAAYEKIVVWFDDDDPGREAVLRWSELFPGKVASIVSDGAKDANDHLMAGKNGIVKLLYGAKEVVPDTVVNASEATSFVDNYIDGVTRGWQFPEPFGKLNEMTVGMQPGRVDVVGAGTGTGKSSFLRELCYSLRMSDGINVAMLSIEETAHDVILGQVSITADMSLHHPKVRETVTKEQLTELHGHTFPKEAGSLYVIDHATNTGLDTLYADIRYLAQVKNVKAFFIDPLGMVVSSMHFDEKEERHQQSSFMLQMSKFAKELNIYIMVVSHGRKSSNGSKSYEEGATMNLDALIGGSACKQTAHTVYMLSRDISSQREVSLVTVAKNRPMSITGDVCTYNYDLDSGRLVESQFSVAQYHEGDQEGVSTFNQKVK